VDSTGTLWTTDDAGATWIQPVQFTDILTDNGAYAALAPPCIVTCPTTADGPQVQAVSISGRRIFIGTADRGVITSTDLGQTWARVAVSERINNVTSFFADDPRNHWIVSSYGRGLWELQFPTIDGSITAQADKSTLKVGELVRLTFTVTNASTVPGVLQSPAVVEVLPNGFSVAAMPAECRSNQFLNAPSRVLCLLGDLNPGASRTLSMTLRMDFRSGSSVLNAAFLGHPLGVDHNTGNDVAVTLFSTP
jgi:uncharacterized repeat protein (TIGR01451 family)